MNQFAQEVKKFASNYPIRITNTFIGLNPEEVNITHIKIEQCFSLCLGDATISVQSEHNPSGADQIKVSIM